jgi:hypothetical protein
MELSTNSLDFLKLLSLNHMFFQDHLYISSINPICILITLHRNSVFFSEGNFILRLLLLFSSDYFHFHHILPHIKSPHSLLLYYYLSVVMLLLSNHIALSISAMLLSILFDIDIIYSHSLLNPS